MSYPQELLKLVAARLYIGSPNIGGKIVNQSTVHGFTEITLNGNIYTHFMPTLGVGMIGHFLDGKDLIQISQREY